LLQNVNNECSPFLWDTINNVPLSLTSIQSIHHFHSFSLSNFSFFDFHSFIFLSLIFSSMAFKKTLTQRLLSITKISSQSLSNCRISSSSLQSRTPSTAAHRDIAPEPGDSTTDGVFRRFLHKRAVFQPEIGQRNPSSADGLLQKLREMDIARSRIRLDGLSPPETEESTVEVKDVRKLLRAAQLEAVKSKLRKIPQSCVNYSEFIQMCGENCSDQEQAKKIAKILDDSATVIILGDVVFLKPEQVNFFLILSV
jgi:hypothetical protein